MAGVPGGFGDHVTGHPVRGTADYSSVCRLIAKGNADLTCDQSQFVRDQWASHGDIESVKPAVNTQPRRSPSAIRLEVAA